jgi:hypothetical protein
MEGGDFQNRLPGDGTTKTTLGDKVTDLKNY